MARDTYKGSRRTRIRIPQPVDRPIKLLTRNVIQKGELRPKDDYFTMHRLGLSRRTTIGEDPLEARAVPKYYVRGTLPERIVYKWLTRNGMDEGGDFDFQSSTQGGRIELGGIVLDFLFPQLKIALQVQGPTHFSLMRRMKDQEQEDAMAEFGYTMFFLDIDLIYNEYRFEDEMRRIFNYGPGYGSSLINYGDDILGRILKLIEIYSRILGYLRV